jgi:hypothetical protein
MSVYRIRVELHGAEESEYQVLWDEMRAQGFRRTLTGDNGQVFGLPSGEYSYEAAAGSASTMVAVRDLVEVIAQKTRRRGKVLVSPADAWCAAGLTAYQPAAGLLPFL